MRDVIFLSAPYSHLDPAVVEERVKQVAVAAANIERSGRGHVIAPILPNHLMVKHGNVPKETAWWYSQFLTLLSRSDKLWVLKLDGWDKSVGVAQEIESATENNIPIMYLEPVELEGPWVVTAAMA